MKILLVEGGEGVLSRRTQRQELVDRNVSAMFGDDLWLSADKGHVSEFGL